MSNTTDVLTHLLTSTPVQTPEGEPVTITEVSYQPWNDYAYVTMKVDGVTKGSYLPVRSAIRELLEKAVNQGERQ